MEEKCFTNELSALINKHSVENNSSTPDYMLAEYIRQCLVAFEMAVNSRDKWYGLRPFKRDSIEDVSEMHK